MSQTQSRPPAIRFRRLAALTRKEFLQIVRDPSSILIAFVLPLILLFLFGYGVSLDANRIRIGLVVQDGSPTAADLAETFLHSHFFHVRLARDTRDCEGEMTAGHLRGIVVIPAYFSERLAQPGAVAPVQVLTDGSEPNTASFVQNYVEGLVGNWSLQRALSRGASVDPPVQLEPRVWFNPGLESRRFLVPGAIAIIIMLIGTMLTALVIAREWERGTMEAMMATPVGIAEIVVGKVLPYFALGMGSVFLCVGIATLVFGLPFEGSLPALGLASTAFLAAALGLGMLISAVARSQFVAAQIALVAAFLPALLLSGFIFEIRSMPWPIQWTTHIVPARYFVPCLQSLFVAGDLWDLILPNVLALTVMALILFTVTALKSAKRLV